MEARSADIPSACLRSSPSSVSLAAYPMEKTPPTITVYLKTFCGWSQGVRAILAKYDLPYEEKDIIKNPAFRWEMEQRSGQSLSPCVLVDGHMLADVSGAEVENWLVTNGYVERSETAPSAPINSSCPSES
jgi:glutaredoxin